MTAEIVPDVLLGNSYLSRSRWASDIWFSARSLIPRNLVAELADCVFVMFKPDAIAGGKSDALWQALRSAGFQVVHVGPCLQAGPREYEELYKFNLTLQNEQNMLSAWWLTSRLFTMSPALGLIVRAPEGARSGDSAYLRFSRLKGPSNPYACGPGQLRHDLMATNTALNLLHSADDPISSLREFMLFGEAADLVTALGRSAALRSDNDHRPIVEEIDESYERAMSAAATPLVQTDFVDVLITIKLRLLYVSASQEWKHTEDLYRDYRDMSGRSTSPAGRWSRFRELSRREKSLLDDMPRTNDPARRLLHDLATVNEYGLDLARRVGAGLRELRLPFTEWEELVLDTSMHYGQSIQTS